MRILNYFYRVLPCAIGLCIISSCQNLPNSSYSTEQNSYFQQTEEEQNIPPAPSPSQPLLPKTPPVDTPIDTDVWDVSDVDISDVDISKKLIAFTFDDAPAKTLENILAVFASFNENNPDCKATATLFCNSSLCNNHSIQLLYTAKALGFELGNHTHSHFDLTSLTETDLQYEIDETDRLLQKIDQQPRHLLRAPFGKINDLIREQVSVPIIDWTIDTLDWTKISAESIYDSVFLQKFSGAIVLMHDGYEHTVSALKRLLPDLKAEGYQVVSVSKLAKAHGCHLRAGKVYIRARKQANSPYIY